MRATFLSTIGTFALKAKFASNIFQIPLILLPPTCFVHPTRNIYATLFKSWFVRPVIVNCIANHHIQVSKKERKKGSEVPFFYSLLTRVCIYNILESKLFMNPNYESSLSITIKWQKGPYRLMRDLNENECGEIHTHKWLPQQQTYKNNSRLSFVGIKTVFSVLVNSKRRWDICISKFREQHVSAEWLSQNQRVKKKYAYYDINGRSEHEVKHRIFWNKRKEPLRLSIRHIWSAETYMEIRNALELIVSIVFFFWVLFFL